MRDRIKTLAASVMSWLDEWLFPEKILCLCCSHALGEDSQSGLCPSCEACLDGLTLFGQQAQDHEVIQPLQGIDVVYAAFPYDAQARMLVRMMKFESVRAAAVPLAQAMCMLPFEAEDEILVPVPTTKARIAKRGFNQAELLAKHMSEILGMESVNALSRADDRPAQSKLGGMDRRINLVGCVRSDDAVRGRCVLLVDDVVTTGATAMECARALRKAGAKRVDLVCACRAGEKNGDEMPF